MNESSRQSSDGYRQLMEQVIAGNGLRGLTSTLARLAGCDAVVADDELEPLHCRDGIGQSLDHADCQLPASLKQGITFEFKKELGEDHSSARSFDPPMTEVRDSTGIYVIAPILLPGETAGYVWTRMPASVPDSDDYVRRLVGEAAAAFAVEFVRQRAMLDGEQRVRNSFLEDLLSGRLTSVSATRRRAKFLGYDLRGHHIVFVLDLDNFREFAVAQASDEAGIQRIKHRFRQGVEGWLDSAWGSSAMVWEHSDALVVLTQATKDHDRSTMLQRVETLRAHVQLRLAGPSISAGIGRPATSMARLQESFAQAEHAARIGSVVFGAGTTTDYSDLGVYRLLFHLRHEPELVSFCEETIGRLEEYDAGHEGQLTETIQTYLELQGNVTRAAEALHLHRNGLLYRLNRIQDLAGVSLDNPTERLALQLALLARPLVKKQTRAEHRPEHLPLTLSRQEETA
jgi:sugar diacid utilization regulator